MDRTKVATRLTVPEPLGEAATRWLLEQNAQVKLGAWQVERMGGCYLAVFSAQEPADADRQILLSAVQAVLVTADEMEHEPSGGDEF